MTQAPLKVTEMVRKVNSDTPAANGVNDIAQGSTLRFHIPYVGGNAILNPKSIVIRGEFIVGVTDPQAFVFFMREGIHGIFRSMRVLHGDRLIEEIERYSDYASWYSQLHWGGANGTSVRCPSDFTDLGNYVAPPANQLWPISGVSSIGPLIGVPQCGHEFAFTPLSAVLGSRATQEKFPLAVLNPMEPLVLEFDLDRDGSLINWSGAFPATVGTFTLRNCYLNADYDMIGSTLGMQLKSSMNGITWDIPGLEKHEHEKLMPQGESFVIPGYCYGGSHVDSEIMDQFYIRSNVQAMTRMIHYFKHKGYETAVTTNVSERAFLQYPELTRWQYLIGNQFVPDRPITATIYFTSGLTHWPRVHFGRMYTTSMKAVGELMLEPRCGFHPMFDFVFDYSKKLPGLVTAAPAIFSMTKPYEESSGVRGDDGGFFLAYDFTRQIEGGAPKRSPWGDGSFKLKDTEFEVQLGMNNTLGMSPDDDPTAYTLVVVTLVEYKRKLVLDKLGRLEAYF